MKNPRWKIKKNVKMMNKMSTNHTQRLSVWMERKRITFRFLYRIHLSHFLTPSFVNAGINFGFITLSLIKCRIGISFRFWISVSVLCGFRNLFIFHYKIIELLTKTKNELAVLTYMLFWPFYAIEQQLNIKRRTLNFS